MSRTIGNIVRSPPSRSKRSEKPVRNGLTSRIASDPNLHRPSSRCSRRVREFKDRVEERRLELRELEAQARHVLRRRRCHRAAQELEPKRGLCDPNDPLDGYPKEVAQAQSWLDQLRRQWAPRFLASGALVGILMVIWLVVIGIGLGTMPAAGDQPGTAKPSYWLVSWIAAGGAISCGCVAIIYVVLRPVIVRQTLDTFDHFRQSIANADIALDAAVKLRAAEADTKKIAAQRQCDHSLQVATVDHQKKVEELAARRENRLREVAENLQSQRKTVATSRDTRQKAVNQQFSRDSQQMQDIHATQSRQSEERQQAEIAASREMYERGWQRLVARWREGLLDFQAAVAQMGSYCDERFPAWESTDWESATVIDDSLPALRFGRFAFSLRGLEGGVPEHADLLPPQVDFDLPAVLSFATRPSLLLEAWGEGRVVATRAMQNVMLRLLTALPPGKVRFTIIDPVGLGENFSAFMHLADFDEKLSPTAFGPSRQHIDQRLADLTEAHGERDPDVLAQRVPVD